MIRDLVGSNTAEKVLLFIANYGEGYATGIAECFELRLYQVQKILNKYEQSGLLVSVLKGKTRVFTWNPRYPLKTELLALLEATLRLLPKEEVSRYFRARTRPRKIGKNL
jgi:hypothetical protein